LVQKPIKWIDRFIN